MKYCDTDLRPDLTFGRAELALKVCLATGWASCGRGREIAIPLEDGVLVDSLLTDQTVQRQFGRQHCSVFKDHCALRRGRED